MKKTKKILPFIIFNVLCGGTISASANEINSVDSNAYSSLSHNKYLSIIKCKENLKFNFGGQTLNCGSNSNPSPTDPSLPKPNLPDKETLVECTSLNATHVQSLNDYFGARTAEAWCDTTQLMSIASYGDFPEEAVATLLNLKSITLNADDCDSYSSVDLGEIKDLSKIEKFTWNYVTTNKFDLSNMTSLNYLGFMDYYYEISDDDYVFNTSDLNDKNMIESLLTIPKYKTGEFSGPTIVVDDTSSYTDDQITAILSNHNVGFDSRSIVENNFSGKLNTWDTAISLQSMPLKISYNLEANKTYVFFEDNGLKFNPNNGDGVIYDSNGDQYNDGVLNNISATTLNSPLNIEYTNLYATSFMPMDSGEYTFELNSHGSNTFNLVDITTFQAINNNDEFSLFSSNSDYDLETEKGSQKLFKDVFNSLYKDNTISWFTPFYYGDINVGEWTQVDINGYKKTNIDYRVELKAGKHYLITNSGQNGESATYRSSYKSNEFTSFEKNGQLYNYDDFKSWNGMFDYQYFSPTKDITLFINNTVGGDPGIKIVPYHIGVFEVPIVDLSGVDLIKYHRALLAGNLKPNISFDVLEDKPESGVTNSFNTRQYVANEILKLDLLVDKRYIVIHGGINRTSGQGRFDESISNANSIVNSSLYLTTQYNDWNNSFSYIVYDGNKDTINFSIYGSYNSIKEGDDYFYGVFEVANDYVPTRENVIDDFVKDLYPLDHFNLSNKTQEVAFNVFDRDYLYNADYSQTENHYHLNPDKYYALVRYLDYNARYQHLATTKFIAGNYAEVYTKDSSGTYLGYDRNTLPFTTTSFPYDTYTVYYLKKGDVKDLKVMHSRDSRNSSGYMKHMVVEADVPIDDNYIMKNVFYADADKLQESDVVTLDQYEDSNWKEVTLAAGEFFDVVFEVDSNNGYNYALSNGENGELSINLINLYKQSEYNNRYQNYDIKPDNFDNHMNYVVTLNYNKLEIKAFRFTNKTSSTLTTKYKTYNRPIYNRETFLLDGISTFPESYKVDTDDDGILDILDIDDDNDGFSDEVENTSGTDPLDENSKPSTSTWGAYLNLIGCVSEPLDANKHVVNGSSISCYKSGFKSDMLNVENIGTTTLNSISFDHEINLKDLDILNSVNTVTGDIYLYETFSLVNLDGLININEVPGEFYLESSPLLTSIDGLSSLEIVGSSLYLIDIPTIDFRPLSNLRSVEDIYIDKVENALFPVNGNWCTYKVYEKLSVNFNNNSPDALATIELAKNACGH